MCKVISKISEFDLWYMDSQSINTLTFLNQLYVEGIVMLPQSTLHEWNILYSFSARNSTPLFKDDFTLYHYTSPEGLAGILSSRSVYFTNSNYLNDYEERKNVYRILNTILKSGDARISPELKGRLATLTFDDYINSRVLNPAYKCFVFSCSKNADNLTVWTYYTKNKEHSGYNIGFHIKPKFWEESAVDFWEKHLTEQSSPLDIFFASGQFGIYDVMYDDNEKKRLLLQLLNDGNSLLKQNYDIDYVFRIIQAGLSQIEIFFKHPSFSAEEEVRLVYFLDTANPYYSELEKQLQREKEKEFFVIPVLLEDCAQIKNITISPLGNKNEMIDFAQRQLEKSKMFSEISFSSIPLRY